MINDRLLLSLIRSKIGNKIQVEPIADIVSMSQYKILVIVDFSRSPTAILDLISTVGR